MREHILVSTKADKGVSLWCREGDFHRLMVNANGSVIPTPRPKYSVNFKHEYCVLCPVTQTQADAAVMVARTVSEEIWHRYATRIMNALTKGE